MLSLRRSVGLDFAKIESFLNEGIDILGKVPQTIDEIGDATQKHAALAAKLPAVIIFNDPLLDLIILVFPDDTGLKNRSQAKLILIFSFHSITFN